MAEVGLDLDLTPELVLNLGNKGGFRKFKISLTVVPGFMFTFEKIKVSPKYFMTSLPEPSATVT